MAIAAIAFGIVAMMLANGFIEWIFVQIRESTIQGHLGHIQVVRPGYHDAGKSDPFAYLLPADGPAFDVLANQPGVVTIAPRLGFSGLASNGDTTVSFVGEGVSPSREAELSSSLVIADGANLREADANGLLLGVGLARNLGASVGDRIVLVVTRSTGGVNAVELAVRGIFSTEIKAYDDSALRVPIEISRRLLHTNGAHAWLLLLDETTHTDVVATALRSQLPPQDYQVVPWHHLADFYNKTVALFSKQVLVMRAIIAAIISLSIMNTMIMSVMERTGEIGTMMALGARRRNLLSLFVAEGGLVGLIGGLIGLLLGTALAKLISVIGIPMPPAPGMAHGFVGQILVTWSMACDTFLLAATTTCAASLYPAWKGSRMVIVDALRVNR